MMELELLIPHLKIDKAIKYLHTDDIRKQLRKATKIFHVLEAKKFISRHGIIQYGSHPIIEDWVPYENALSVLMNVCILTLNQRTTQAKLPKLYKVFFPVKHPLWLNQPLVNKYRRELLTDRPDFYSQYAWTEPLYSGG